MEMIDRSKIVVETDEQAVEFLLEHIKIGNVMLLIHSGYFLARAVGAPPRDSLIVALESYIQIFGELDL